MNVDDLIAWLESRHLRGHEREAYLQMRKASEEFGRDCSKAMDRARDKIGRVSMDMGRGGSPSPEFRAYIVDMIRAGLEDGLALAILDRVYLQNGMYEELFGVCDDILKFRGYPKDMMMGSRLVESAMHRLVCRLLAWKGSEQERDGLVTRCVGLLEGRARMLGIDISGHGEESSLLYRADLIAMDVLARRHFEPPSEIMRFLECYPRLCVFLRLTPDKVSSLVQKKADLVYYASIAIHERGSAPFHEIPRANPIDGLELLLQAMESRGPDIRDARYDSWRGGLCGKEFLQRILEMRLYLHFLAVDRDVELEPRIGGCKRADLRALGMYVEAFAPHEATRTAFGHIVLKNYPDDLVRKIRKKHQIDAFGGRRSMIVVEDPHSYVDDKEFQKRLVHMIRQHGQLGGVLIARDVGTHYRCKLVKNPGAVSGITPSEERTIMQALGTPYCQ